MEITKCENMDAEVLIRVSPLSVDSVDSVELHSLLTRQMCAISPFSTSDFPSIVRFNSLIGILPAH